MASGVGMTDPVRRLCRELIGLTSHLDGMFSDCGPTPLFHRAKVAAKLGEAIELVTAMIQETDALPNVDRARFGHYWP